MADPPPPVAAAPPLPPRRHSSAVLASVPAADELHALIRRFNHQTHHIISDPGLPKDSLDFSTAPSSVFRPEVLRCNVERIHLTVFKSAVRTYSELARLRSWQEPIRTSAYALVYFLAWKSPVGVGPVAAAFVAALLVSPAFRGAAFPPLDQQPRPVQTGEGEHNPFEDEGGETGQDERDAQEFADDLARLAQVSASPEEDLNAQAANQPSTLNTANEDSASTFSPIESALEDEMLSSEKKAKVDRLARIGLPLQTITGDLADGWERWANALNPSPPFPQHAARVKLALIVFAIAVALAVIPARLLQKGVMAAVGVAFFGGPIIERGLEALDKFNPKWKEELELRNSLLKGVPSNSQLTITLLRAGERAGKPLPPAPPITTPPTSRQPSATSVVPLAPERRGSVDSIASTAEVKSKGEETKKKSKFKLANIVKGAAALTEHGAGVIAGHKSLDWEGMSRVVVDEMKRRTGSALPELLMAVVPASAPDSNKTDNATFFGHLNTRPGHLILRPPAAKAADAATGNEFDSGWTLEFVGIFSKGAKSSTKEPPPLPPRPDATTSADSVAALATKDKKPATVEKHLLRLPVEGITSLRKTTGLGWKARLAAGWATGVDSLGDGIVIRWVDSPEQVGAGTEQAMGREAYLGGIVRRDELFNRLASIGQQRFKSC